MPAKKNAGSDGFNVHRGGFKDRAVWQFVFNDFFVKLPVLSPAGDGVEIFKMTWIRRDVKIAETGHRVVRISRAVIKFAANHELKQADRVVSHAAHHN